jgi:nitrogen-specific signal transduction histidine kinase
VRYRRAVDLVELTGILQTSASGLSIGEIAEEFDVSRRTAERMLGALRDRFPNLSPILRNGRKYWKLPSDSRGRPIQLPRTLDALSERIIELEHEVAESRNRVQELQGVAESVFSTTLVGMLLIDRQERVAWMNEPLAACFNVSGEELIGLEVGAALRQVGHAVDDPQRLAAHVGCPQEERDADFECRLLPVDGRERGVLRSWSRPVETGPYAGGRVERFVEVQGLSSLPLPAAPTANNSEVHPVETIPEDVSKMLNEHLQTLRDAAAEVLEAPDLPEPVVKRLTNVVRAHARTIRSSLDVMQAGSMKVEPVSVSEVLETVASLARPAFEEQGVEIVAEAEPDLPLCYADRVLLASNLAMTCNLTLDALPPGCQLALRAERPEGGVQIRISIVDDGPPLPDDFPDILGAFLETRSGGSAVGVANARDENGKPTGGIIQYFDLPTTLPEQLRTTHA